MTFRPLPAEVLSVDIPTAELPFRTTDELPCLDGFFGHSRATDAIDFALAMAGRGYNLFVLGEPGTGRSSLIADLLQRTASAQPEASDWLYLPHFGQPREPVPLAMPAGTGAELVKALETLIEGLLVSVGTALENPAYLRRRAQIERQFKDRYDAALDGVAEQAGAVGIAMFRDGEAVSFAPLKDDAPVDEQGFGELNDQERDRFHKALRKLEEDLSESLVELPQWKRETGDRRRLLAGEWVEQAVAPLYGAINEKYRDAPDICAYLDQLRADFRLTIVPVILEEETHAVGLGADADRRSAFRRRYVPRLLVDRSGERGAPVIFEPDPGLQNLFGRIEYVGDPGAPNEASHLTDPGALHRANGGYLVLEADKVLADPDVWSALKRVLKSGALRFETPTPEPGLLSSPTLSPGPIPLRVKIALIGTAELYYALRDLDPEFPELFRVVAELDGYFPRDGATMREYACLLKTLAARQGLPALDAGAVTRLLTHSARLAEHQSRLSARVGTVMEAVFEADLFRRRRGDGTISIEHVEEALAAKARRIGRVRQELLTAILDGTVLIATEGQASGRVNALTLLEIGDSRIGLPARITATAHVGNRGIFDIEREAALGQPIHSKGVMILGGYLGQQFARRFPLAMSASLALEQSYGYVDGDSAALAELCALLSALTGMPMNQSCAVTGSLNQYGEVQAVGGINEKIEGFFELCQARGLTGRQGVVMPQANVPNLVLAKPVVQAVREGGFALYAVQTADQALEILTGQPPGLIREMAGSVLERFAEIARARAR